MSARMAAKVAGLALLLLAGSAPAQTQDPGWQVPSSQQSQSSTSLHFTKLPNEALPVPSSTSGAAPTIGRSPWETRPTNMVAQEPARNQNTLPPPKREPTFQQKYPTPTLPRLPVDETSEMLIPLEPPGPQRLYRLDSEAEMMERMRQEAKERSSPERITFPEEPIVSKLPYTGRTFPAMACSVEPNYVLYRRLFFEERNSERYGWDLGILNPFVSAGAFYWDLALLPYQVGSLPFRRFESNAGLCLPGDAVPYMLYPPNWSVTGSVAEAGVIVALFAIFP